MAASWRRRVLEEFQRRLQTIVEGEADTHGGTFETSVGHHVLLGAVPRLGPSDPPLAVAIVTDEEEPTYQGEHVRGELPVLCVAVANTEANLEEPWLAAESVLADIKRAIETDDRFLGGLCRHHLRRGTTKAFERVAGSEMVGIAITYLVPIVEVWGHPEP